MNVSNKWSALGASGDLVNLSQLTSLLSRPVGERMMLIANHNLHSVYLLRRNPWMHSFFHLADITHIDGMPLVWIARLLGYPARREHRVTYVDWLPGILSEVRSRGWRVFYLGSTEQGFARGMETLRKLCPSAALEGRHGYFDMASGSEESMELRNAIRQFKPDLVLVGMGMPRQESWILSNADVLVGARVLPCGAAVDFLAGIVRTPPRWMGRWGLEWLYRLIAEPRRLAYRYLVEPMSLIGPLATEILRRFGHRNGER